MSSWVYVNGTILVDTYANSSAEAMFLAQTVVNHLPKITGSEGDVEYYLNLVNGHNVSSSWDEFGNFSNLYTDTYYHAHESQSCVLITMYGALRDREFKDTLPEVVKMLNRLSGRLGIDNCLVSVHCYEDSYVFNNPDWVVYHAYCDWIEQRGLRIRPQGILCADNKEDEEQKDAGEINIEDK